MNRRATIIPLLVSLLTITSCQVQKAVEEAVFDANRPAKRDFTEERMNTLQKPNGVQMAVYAKLQNPRMMVTASNGDVYVSQPKAGKITLLRDANSDGVAEITRDVVSGKDGVHGLALHNGRLYIASVKEIMSAPINEDGSLGTMSVHVNDLPDGGQHPNRTMGFGPDGKLYVSIGSTCNACEEADSLHATILRMNPDGSNRQIYAKGLRNTIGFKWHPATNELWGMDHGSDHRGNDTPPEELNRLVMGGHYGWPFSYGDKIVDPITAEPEKLGMTKQQVSDMSIGSVMGYQAHSAPIEMVFYNGSMFPPEYQGDAFVAMRGSWNREQPTGYKVVRINFENGQPTKFEDFISGWLTEGGAAQFGRLAGLTVTKDGALLISDDANGIIYRASYSQQSVTGTPSR